MNAVVRITVPQELLSLVRLAHLLQAIEARAQAADPHQYRLLVDKLSAELAQHQGHPALPQLLDHVPAASEVYENLQYAHAGLVRAPLEQSLNSELAARQLIGKVQAGA